MSPRRAAIVLAMAALTASGSFAAEDQQNSFAQHAKSAQAAIASNDAPAARRELQAMLDIDPGNVDAHANLGMVEFLQGEYKEAARHFEAALTRAPALETAQAFLGMCEVRLGMAERGRERIEKALPRIADRTLHVQAGLELVRSYTEAGMLDKAAPVLERLAAFDPANSEILYTLYRLHTEMAAAALRRLTAAGMESPWVHEVIGQNYMAQDQYGAAIREFRTAIERGPRLTGLRYQLGEALFAEARTEENRALAEKEFLAELKMNPGDAGCFYKLGEIAMERSDYARAKSFVAQALAARPGFAEAHAAMGKILEQAGDKQGAISELEAAVKFSPEMKATHYKLAQLYRSQGRRADAEREFKIVQTLMDQQLPGPLKSMSGDR